MAVTGGVSVGKCGSQLSFEATMIIMFILTYFVTSPLAAAGATVAPAVPLTVGSSTEMCGLVILHARTYQ